jgi:hypothetical protein
MRDLPPFKRRRRADVLAYISAIFINEKETEVSQVTDLIEYGDGHYRVLFNPAYFVLNQDQAEPTKSQWNSLKKKMKRRESTVFVFKEYGEVGTKEKQYYLDFGFLPELPPSANLRSR